MRGIKKKKNQTESNSKFFLLFRSYYLINAQPTLHKPGIMAHSVRVLHDPKQKTIRMHYASKFSTVSFIVAIIKPAYYIAC
jgi:hypothetical protein